MEQESQDTIIQISVRMPIELHSLVKEQAIYNKRSMNSEIIFLLENNTGK